MTSPKAKRKTVRGWKKKTHEYTKTWPFLEKGKENDNKHGQ